MRLLPGTAGLVAMIPLGVSCGADEGSGSLSAKDDAEAAVTEPKATTGKAIFVVQPSDSGSPMAVREAVRRDIAPRLAADPRIGRLVVSLPLDEEAERPAVASLVEIYADALALRELATDLDSSLGADAKLHAYLVHERVPRRSVQDRPGGAPTPGVRMVALMVRSSKLSRAEFEAYWRDEHTPIALAHTIQVLHYSQNTVVERLTEGSRPIDGIVGEQFASPRYSRDRMLRHPIQFMRGVASALRFMDLAKTRSQLMIETVIELGHGA